MEKAIGSARLPRNEMLRGGGVEEKKRGKADSPVLVGWQKYGQRGREGLPREPFMKRKLSSVTSAKTHAALQLLALPKYSSGRAARGHPGWVEEKRLRHLPFPHA